MRWLRWLPPLTLRPLVTWRQVPKSNPCLFTLRSRQVYAIAVTYFHLEDGPCVVAACTDPGTKTVYVTFGAGTWAQPDSVAFSVKACPRHAAKMESESARVFYPARYGLLDWTRRKRRQWERTTA